MIFSPNCAPLWHFCTIIYQLAIYLSFDTPSRLHPFTSKSWSPSLNRPDKDKK